MGRNIRYFICITFQIIMVSLFIYLPIETLSLDEGLTGVLLIVLCFWSNATNFALDGYIGLCMLYALTGSFFVFVGIATYLNYLLS